MRINPAVILAILRKDLHGLLPLIVLASVVFLIEPVVASLDLESDIEIWAMLKANFYLLSFFLSTLLMISVIQLDPAASTDHDWLTRPISRLNWMLAKLLFLFLTICVPVVLARTLVNLTDDLTLADSLFNALAIENLPGLLPLPLIFSIALLTGTLRKAILIMITVFIASILPAWNVSQPLFNFMRINISEDFGPLMWIQGLPMMALGLTAAGLVYWLRYCRRRSVPAYFAFSAMLVLVFLTMFVPRGIYSWDEAIAIHKWMINSSDASIEDAVAMEQATACFISDAVDDGVFVAADWREEQLANAGAGAVTFATTVRSRISEADWFSASNVNREVVSEWRAAVVRVEAHYSADSLADDIVLQRATSAVNRFSPVAATDTNYWLVSAADVGRLAGDPSTRLTLEYEVALLAPTSYELKTDGERHALDKLGNCRATLNTRVNVIEVDCVKRGIQPDLVSTQLAGVRGTRNDNYFRPNFKPDWLEFLSSEHYELTIDSPDLADHSSVMVTAYEIERVLHKEVVSQGVFGAALSICPLPSESQLAAIEKSSWGDRSPHEASSIAVERGVRLEVLDWRSEDHMGLPTLVMIPGLGATAHSFDDLAQALAGKYQVIGITRRGTGGSSAPDHGYDLARLSQDILEVLDTLDIENPILVGHSMGSEELSYIGANHPDRVAGLVYLDAAYDRTVVHKELRNLEASLPPTPPPTPAEFNSYQSAQQYAERIGASRNIPEGEILASYDFSTGANKLVSKYLDAIAAAVVKPDYDKITVPALGIFAVPTSADSLMEPWYDPDDPTLREKLRQKFQLERAFKLEQISLFDNGIAESEVVILDDADHWIFLSNEEDVLKAIDSFVVKVGMTPVSRSGQVSR